VEPVTSQPTSVSQCVRVVVDQLVVGVVSTAVLLMTCVQMVAVVGLPQSESSAVSHPAPMQLEEPLPPLWPSGPHPMQMPGPQPRQMPPQPRMPQLLQLMTHWVPPQPPGRVQAGPAGVALARTTWVGMPVTVGKVDVPCGVEVIHTTTGVAFEVPPVVVGG
jgi:hypothetical protein